MRFLLDQDVYAVTKQFLIALGHEVVTASELGLSQAEDSALLDLAKEGNIRISNDWRNRR